MGFVKAKTSSMINYKPSKSKKFNLPFGDTMIYGDRYNKICSCIVLHGAGHSSRKRFVRLRKSLNEHRIPSASFDFIGHGETGGEILGSTLEERTRQAKAVIRKTCKEPITVIGASMSGYTAIQLTQIFEVKNLILLVPAVYTLKAYDLPFGPNFSLAIRTPGSWKDSDAFNILNEFKGNLLVITAEFDDVIPAEVGKRIYTSAKNARSRCHHIVNNSKHLSLFSKHSDFKIALNMIMDLL